jgi:phosphohistidine swiveling domain-containing protein
METAKGSSPQPLPTHNPNELCPLPQGSDPISDIILSIESQFEIIMGRPERVEADCARLRQELAKLPASGQFECLARLLPCLRLQAGPLALPVFALFEELCSTVEEPWPLLKGMLSARDRHLVLRALDLAARRVQSGSLITDRRIALFLAEQVDSEASPLADPEALRRIETILRALPSPGREGPDPILTLYLTDEPLKLRRLAARLLDLNCQPASPDLARLLLGAEAFSFLNPYLDYTRATHLDLLHLAPRRGIPPPALPSLIRAQEVCGEALLREVIAELGWPRVNLALEVHPYCGISIGGSLPVEVFPCEAPLFESCREARRVRESCLFIAHGGLPLETVSTGEGAAPADRFRSYNLAHAEVLADILDVAPLTREKIWRVLARMDRIVEDFIALFSSYTEETAILPGVYLELKQKIIYELQRESRNPQLSAELTRLVQMFDDPAAIGAVRTLHGLKRYLHQRGLRLGIRLIQGGRGTNRTVDLVYTSRRRVLRSIKGIRYVDFEPEQEAGELATAIPYPVAALARGFARHLLHGHKSYPGVEVFCYGNEVHYYLSYANHPAFLRIDYSPPLQGGMIDLEYYGVSKYELSLHPNLSLDAIRLFFRRLEFDVQIEATRIRARYDKERALDLGDLCDKAEILFALAPYLMEVDWVIGGLRLDREARAKVGEGWAEHFVLWGTLPIGELLTQDRQSILLAVESGPAGEREIRWSGEGPYCDRFSTSVPPGFFEQLGSALKSLGLDISSLQQEGCRQAFGQINLERCILRPLREAIARGELISSALGIQRAPSDLFRHEHEAAKFAELMNSPDETLLSSAILARLVAPLERSLRFRTTGDINHYEIQRSSLPLRGERLGLYVMRDRGGIIRLALFARGEALCCRRISPSEPWYCNGTCDAFLLASLLRRSNYTLTGVAPSSEEAGSEAAGLREYFQRESGQWRPAPEYGERIMPGLKASPGRAVGPALFGTAFRSPVDLDGAVLIAPSVRPEDNTFLYHSAGIVSTGGGVLSHAGLIATQFRKPALIISGRWLQEADQSTSLLYTTLEYREEKSAVHGVQVTIRRDLREREFRLREGDLVALDADEGTLRVLGQDRQTLALHEGFRAFAEESSRLAQLTNPAEVLVSRGHRLRARHQIEKLLGRITDPVLARHTVYEILLGKTPSGEAVPGDEKAPLLSLILTNCAVGDISRNYLRHIAGEVQRKYGAFCERARQHIPSTTSAYEVLSVRLGALRLHQSLKEIAASLRVCELQMSVLEPCGTADIESAALCRLHELRGERARRLQQQAPATAGLFRSRQLLRQLELFGILLGDSSDGDGDSDVQLRQQLALEDEVSLRRLQHELVLEPESCGAELFPLIGWKAANLAEVQRLGGRALVPRWFVVTDRAFTGMLDSPLDKTLLGLEGVPPDASDLRAAIDGILARTDIDLAQKSAYIRNLWDKVPLPELLSAEVGAAYRRLQTITLAEDQRLEKTARLFVAIRSSACEEDAEVAPRAGEFETFLFISGEEELLKHLKRAWSGLWTERAIHNRAVLSTPSERTGGGVIVQRIVNSRISGVLQTINVAEGETREIVINVGLGLGEGIVSGLVTADQIVVDKESATAEGPLRFRYITGDKRERVVFNRRSGIGTIREETLYHQRLRPALEYVELAELVRTAVSLEDAYGYPLDIEFSLDDTRLWTLQVRPVAAFMSTIRETLEHYPFHTQSRI